MKWKLQQHLNQTHIPNEEYKGKQQNFQMLHL